MLCYVDYYLQLDQNNIILKTSPFQNVPTIVFPCYETSLASYM